MNTSEYDLNPINFPTIDVARERFALTDIVALTFEPGDMTRYRIVLLHNGETNGNTLTIERHAAYGSLRSESSTVISAPANDTDCISPTDTMPISNNNVHSSLMLAALINNFLER